MKRTMLFALSALAGGVAFAEGESQRKDPAKPEVPVPPVTYRSAFEDYRPYREEEVLSWRAVNEEVARVGGHIGVLKAGQEPKPESQNTDARAHGHGQGGHR